MKPCRMQSKREGCEFQFPKNNELTTYMVLITKMAVRRTQFRQNPAATYLTVRVTDWQALICVDSVV